MSAGGGAGAVLRQGYLRKLKTMKRKYFVLRGETADCSPRLEYYESQKKFRGNSVPRRVIPLKSCFNISRRLDLKQRHVIALYTKEEQFCVVADGEPELHAWLTDLLHQHQKENTIEELLHPTQHVWQVNVQKKGLGTSKNIIGLYNLCLTDKTLALVKIRSNNNLIGEPTVSERVEFSLRNIRRCGDSECFFYIEVGRLTATGAGELWMHTDDANIALSMHHTIYNAMCNCKDEKEMQPAMRDRSSSATDDPRTSTLPARRSTYSDGRGRAGLTSLAIDDHYSLTESTKENRRIKHHRTVSLPTGCALFQEPLKIVHERTRSAPLTGDEVDRVTLDKARHSSCRAVNGGDGLKKNQWSRRASTGTRLSKLSPAHTKNSQPMRNRCDSMPSRSCPPIESDRAPSRLPTVNADGDTTRDEIDSTTDWHRTPRIPEEPDYCEMNSDIMHILMNKMSESGSHSRTSSLAAEEDTHIPMSASSDTVCSGTPSTDPRFSEYQLEHAVAHISVHPRAYSVGSRPAPAHAAPAPATTAPHRLRAHSLGARRGKERDQHLMEIDFTATVATPPQISKASTPPSSFTPRSKGFKARVDEYVDMSPRTAGYVDMKPSEGIARSPVSHVSHFPHVSHVPHPPHAPAAPVVTTPDGYVEMNYGKRPEPSRPITITAERLPPPTTPEPPRPDAKKTDVTPMGSQTIFQLNLDSPASPIQPEENKQELDTADLFDEEIHHHPLTTVREISEECGRKSPEIGSPPHYVTLARTVSQPIAAPPKLSDCNDDELSCNPTATKTWAGDSTKPARFSAGDERKSTSPAPEPTSLNYAALDLEPRGPNAANAPRAYTQIDFARSEKLHTTDVN